MISKSHAYCQQSVLCDVIRSKAIFQRIARFCFVIYVRAHEVAKNIYQTLRWINKTEMYGTRPMRLEVLGVTQVLRSYRHDMHFGSTSHGHLSIDYCFFSSLISILNVKLHLDECFR